MRPLIVSLMIVAGSACATGAERDVQIRSVDFEAGVIELFNFGSSTEDLTGWRFCSHDFDQQRRYTGASGLNGFSIEAGTSFFIHFNNDAPAGDPDRRNRSALGGSFASPLDQDAYGMQFYFPASNGSVSFGNSNLIADHIQWNIDGAGVGSAQQRTGQAVGTGLWTATGAFIETESDSVRIDLDDDTGGLLHGPSDYSVTPATVDCPGDLNTTGTTNGVPDGQTNISDLQFYLTTYQNDLGMTPGSVADVNTTGTTNGTPDGEVNLSDLQFFLTQWQAGLGVCP